MSAHRHYVSLWRSTHDNGWEAWVGEDVDGEFDVWVCPAGTSIVMRETIECGAEPAKAAALLALGRHSGHHQCSAACGDWSAVDVS